MVVIKDKVWRVKGGTSLFPVCLWRILHVDVTTFMLRKYIKKETLILDQTIIQ